MILGGGFGGVRAALDLGRRRALNITLIDKNKYHSYTPDYYETATAFLPICGQDRKESAQKSEAGRLKSSVAIPFLEIFRNRRNIDIVQDEAASVDFENNKVRAKSGKTFSYDYLVIALGAVSNFFEIPDLKEKSFEDEVFLSHAVVCLSAVFIEDHIADNFEISWLTLSVNIKHKILTYLRTRVDEERQFLARRANKKNA